MRLLIVRHGESQGNITQQLQGRDDPLTDRGRRQAGLVAARLAREPAIAAIYASPLARARETAQIIGQAVGVAPEPRPGLAEIDIGSAAGMTIEDWSTRHPAQAGRWQQEGIDYVWPGGESARQLGERVAAEIDQIMAAHRDDETAIIVSHGGALAWALAHILGERPDGWPEYLFDNCSITEVIIDRETRQVDMRCPNDVAHLSPEAIIEAASG